MRIQIAFVTLGAVLVLTVALGGCGSLVVVDPAPVAPTTTVTTPKQVVEAFYSDYLEYGRNVGSPLADRAYRNSAQLSPDLIEKVDELLASGQGGFDPFLCAQDVPGELMISDAQVNGDEASLVVRQVWNPRTEYQTTRDIPVTLRQVDGQWLMTAVVCR